MSAYFEGDPVSVHLMVGSHEDIHERVKEYFMRLFCKKNSCATCSTCHAIKDEQYYATTWIKPKDNYVLDDLELIFSISSFALEENQKHFFVITQADFLSPQCGNRLLKILEEPPHNYYFILLAERWKNILPTIRSRCVKSSHPGGLSPIYHQKLFNFFIQQKHIDPIPFLKELDQTKINDQETLELLDQLLDHWVEQAEYALDNQNPVRPDASTELSSKRPFDTIEAACPEVSRRDEGYELKIKHYKYAQQMVHIVTTGLAHAPMPGSSNLFWKNLMLEKQELHKKISS